MGTMEIEAWGQWGIESIVRSLRYRGTRDCVCVCVCVCVCEAEAVDEGEVQHCTYLSHTCRLALLRKVVGGD